MKLLVALFLIVCISTFAEAKIYVCLDKTTGEPKGAVDIKPEAIANWAKNFIMVEASEEYRGLDGHKIKYKNQKLRRSTKKEIEDYKAEKENERKLREKTKALEVLGLTDKDIQKLKNMQ